MITRKEFDRAINIIHAYYEQESKLLSEVKNEINFLPKFKFVKPEHGLCDVDMSVRLFNILRFNFFKGRGWNDDPRISELSTISKNDFIKCRNAGKKTLDELEQICLCAGIKLLP